MACLEPAGCYLITPHTSTSDLQILVLLCFQVLEDQFVCCNTEEGLGVRVLNL